jgi:ribosomal protein L35
MYSLNAVTKIKYGRNRMRSRSASNGMKTNKSFSKRLRVTRNGKVVARVPGQDHFNAKEGRRRQMQRRRSVGLTISASNKTRAHYLPGSSRKSK